MEREFTAATSPINMDETEESERQGSFCMFAGVAAYSTTLFLRLKMDTDQALKSPEEQIPEWQYYLTVAIMAAAFGVLNDRVGDLEYSKCYWPAAVLGWPAACLAFFTAYGIQDTPIVVSTLLFFLSYFLGALVYYLVKLLIDRFVLENDEPSLLWAIVHATVPLALGQAALLPLLVLLPSKLGLWSNAPVEWTPWEYGLVAASAFCLCQHVWVFGLPSWRGVATYFISVPISYFGALLAAQISIEYFHIHSLLALEVLMMLGALPGVLFFWGRPDSLDDESEHTFSTEYELLVDESDRRFLLDAAVIV